MRVISRGERGPEGGYKRGFSRVIRGFEQGLEGGPEGRFGRGVSKEGA